jgi:hypothetical protein
MDEPMADTSVYISPGINFSPVSFDGAREATVEVKDFSRSKDLVSASLAASSDLAAYLWRKRRAWAI